MPAILTWTVAQCQLIPDPGAPALNPVGIQAVVKTAGLMEWTVTLAEQAGGPYFTPTVTPIVGPGAPGCIPVISFAPFPPMAPISDVIVRLVDPATGLPLADFVAFVTFRLDRMAP